MNTKIKRINKACAYFPCHKHLEDCTFCYCPFYPCQDINLGSYVITKDKSKIWSCKDCSWIHSKKVVEGILNLIRTSQIKTHKTDKKLSNTGIIILAHGSKLKKANATTRQVIQSLKKKAGFKIIEPAYLQLFEPGLHTSVKRVVEKGCKRIVIVPFFLFMGNHVSRDIPMAIAEEAKIYKDVEFIYANNLGQDRRIVDIVLACIREVL